MAAGGIPTEDCGRVSSGPDGCVSREGGAARGTKLRDEGTLARGSVVIPIAGAVRLAFLLHNVASAKDTTKMSFPPHSIWT